MTIPAPAPRRAAAPPPGRPPLAGAALAGWLLAAVTLLACSSPSPPDTCDVQRTFASAGCVRCHSAPGAAAGLDLTRDAAALGQALLDAPSTACSGRRLIDSRAPGESVILSAVDHTLRVAEGSCALTMPPQKSGDGLSADELACLRSWVDELTADDPPAPFEAVPPATALAKVKLLVHGGAVTADELAAVTADPGNLHGLVEGWAATPQFADKLRSFLGTALQQDSIGAMKETLGFPTAHFDPSRALRAALARSFVDTAMDIVTSGAPFTDVVTTHRRRVTTAELVLLAFSDQTSAELAATTYRVRFVGPDRQAGVPATLTNVGGVWELGGALDAGQVCRVSPPDHGPVPDVQELSSSRFLALLFGRVACRGQGDARYPAPVTAADLADARTIGFEPTGGARIAFTDLAALRALGDGATLRLRVPRPGFFTTSAFLDNWPTNRDNAFRVTLNQTLMVGLGATFAMGDPTAGATEGIDVAHADPSTPCYRCHRLMDPMRPLLGNGLDTDYRAASAPPTTGTFAFFGSTRTGSSADDLAQAIVTHPRFATAWVLKLCSWANSRPCSEVEPGVVELAASFRDSGWNFRKLVIDTVSSPLVTGLSGTPLSQPVDVSITRRRHLCAALRTRLGAVVDTTGVCSDDPDALARGIADDEFARNQPGFVQTAAPGTFHAAGLERLCERLAQPAVAAQFPPGDVPGSTTRLVEQLMGLPPGHPRHDVAAAALASHVSAVVAAGGTANRAMQSAFVVACVSPDVSGVGL